MAREYRPRGMPARYMKGAPDIVRRNVIDIIAILPAAPLDYDIILRPEPGPDQIVGVDFDASGGRGCHFFLAPHEMRAYRERNRRWRVFWQNLPEATQEAIVRYLEE